MLREGSTYFIRTVTYHWIGTLMHDEDGWVTLRDATWVADSGRFSDAIKDPSKLNELEPVETPVLINRDTIVDVVELNYDPPRDQR